VDIMGGLDWIFGYGQPDGTVGTIYRYDSKIEADTAAELYRKKNSLGEFAEDTEMESKSKIRKFDTGATRDTTKGKLDYVKALCPLVLRRYVQYLDKHRLQPDGSYRDFDNWKKGIPRDTYHSSKGRHFFADWLLEEGYEVSDNHGPVDEEDALCAEIFNAMGKLREILKAKLSKEDFSLHLGEEEKQEKFVVPKGWRIKEHVPCGNTETGWSIYNLYTHEFLHKDFTFHDHTGWSWGHKHGEASGYWPTKEAAEDVLKQYLEKQQCGRIK